MGRREERRGRNRRGGERREGGKGERSGAGERGEKKGDDLLEAIKLNGTYDICYCLKYLCVQRTPSLINHHYFQT